MTPSKLIEQSILIFCQAVVLFVCLTHPSTTLGILGACTSIILTATAYDGVLNR